MATPDDVVGFITDPFTGKDVHAYGYDDKAGREALGKQSALARQQAVAQQYSLAQGGGGANPAAVRAAQMNAARTSQAMNQQSLAAQMQYAQQMEAMRGQANMQAQIANQQADAQRDASLMGMAGTAVGGLALMSDRRAKQDVVDLSFGTPGSVPRPAPARSIGGVPVAPLYPNARPEDEVLFQRGPQDRPRPGPARVNAGDFPTAGPTWEAPVRPAPARAQFSDYVPEAQTGPGNRREFESTGAGFGRDYGFDWGQVRSTIGGGGPGRFESEAATMERHAREQGIELTDDDRSQLRAVGSDPYMKQQDQNMQALESGLADLRQQNTAYGQGGGGGNGQQELTPKQKFGQKMMDQGQDMIQQLARPIQAPDAMYRTIQFGPAPDPYVSSDPYMKRDYVSSGRETKRDVMPVPTQVRPRPAYSEALAPADAAAQLGTYGYRYTSEAAASEGEDPNQFHVGPMANRTPDSMERNPVYAPSVKHGPDGFARVDTGRATMENIAVTSDLARRVKALESGSPAVAQGPSGGASRYGEALQMQPQERAALEDQVLAEAGGVQNAAFKGDFDSAARQPVRKAAQPDRVEAPAQTYNVPWEKVSGFEGSQLPPGAKVTKIDDPDEPTRYSYRVEIPQSPTYEGRLAPALGEATRQLQRSEKGMKPSEHFEQERTASAGAGEFYESDRPGGQTELASTDDQLRIREDELKDQIKAQKKPSRGTIRSFANILNKGRAARAISPELVADELRERGVKVKKQEVVDALRDETFL